MDINKVIRSMDENGVKEAVVGGVNIIRYRPTPIESIRGIGRGIRAKNRIERDREIEGKKKPTFSQWARTMEKWGEIEKRYKDSSEEYLNLSQGR